jgi:hypothetical protein
MNTYNTYNTHNLKKIITVPNIPLKNLSEKQWESVEKRNIDIVGRRLFVNRMLSQSIFTDYITEQVEPNKWDRTIVNFRTGDQHPYPYYP